MYISNELREKVERLLKNDEELKREILSGKPSAIRKIVAITQRGIPAEEIVEAYENNQIEQLYRKAKDISELQGVYDELCEAYYAMRRNESSEER